MSLVRFGFNTMLYGKQLSEIQYGPFNIGIRIIQGGLLSCRASKVILSVVFITFDVAGTLV